MTQATPGRRRARGHGPMAAALALLLAAGPVAAGDVTHDRILGFSEDGRYFAFKTYGLQRGSGLPFANLFVVDLDRDAWVPGTPFRAHAPEARMADVEAALYAALAATRAEVLAAGAELLEALAIRRPATVLFARGLGEAHGAPTRIDVARPHPDDPTRLPQAVTTLELEPLAVPGGADHCPDPGALRGYRLRHLPADGPARTLHEDIRIPASRGCPVAYRLDAVVSAGHPAPGGRGVGLISVWRQGFEGLQRHVIALPVPLPGAADRTERGAERGAHGDNVGDHAASFLGAATPQDIDALDAAVRAGLPADPGALRWPDADLSAVVRAVLLTAAAEPEMPHRRLWITRRSAELAPDGAGGPVTLSLVTVARHNLGPARRAALVELFGPDRVAPPEGFGTAPDMLWRLALRPVQGMRADLVAAGRAPAEVADAPCGPVDCSAPDPLRLEGPEAPMPVDADPDPLLASKDDLPSDAGLIARLELLTEADAFLIERGLWPGAGAQAVAFAQGAPVGALVATAGGLAWLPTPVLGPMASAE